MISASNSDSAFCNGNPSYIKLKHVEEESGNTCRYIYRDVFGFGKAV